MDLIVSVPEISYLLLVQIAAEHSCYNLSFLTSVNMFRCSETPASFLVPYAYVVTKRSITT